MEGIIVLDGTVADITGFRGGFITIMLEYTKMKYRCIDESSFSFKTFPPKKAFVDIPYEGAKMLENPEVFGFDEKEQTSHDEFGVPRNIGFGTPTNKIHQGDEVTAYVHWKDFKGRIGRKICDVIVISHTLQPQSLQEMVDKVADELS